MWLVSVEKTGLRIFHVDDNDNRDGGIDVENGDGVGVGDGDGGGDGDGDVVGLNREISFCRWSRLPDYLQAKRQQLSLPAPQRRSPGADYLIWIIVTKNNDSHKNGNDRDHDGGGS